jgi:hypothetical protein
MMHRICGICFVTGFSVLWILIMAFLIFITIPALDWWLRLLGD